MAVGAKLEIRQTQALVMTPQLQQAIRLLQLSNLELSQYVEQELERNPILERADSDGVSEVAKIEDGNLINDPQVDNLGEAIAASDGINDEGTVGDTAAVELDSNELPGTNGLDSIEGSLDANYRENYSNDSITDASAADKQSTDDGGYEVRDWSDVGAELYGSNSGTATLEQVLSSERSLKEHVLEQLNVLLTEPVLRIIGQDLTYHLDESGYLTEDTEFIADRLGSDKELVDSVLVQMQQFDPPGIFARDLAECLALQLREKNRLDPAMQILVENLHLLASMNMPLICETCGVSVEDAEDMIVELKALNPKPGQTFDHDVAVPVVPDVFVTGTPDGGWNVELNSDNLPRLLVNRQYYVEVNKVAGRKEDKTYILECLQSANWLVKSLNQRARTILSVASELVRQQDDFLANGVQNLRPLNLRAVAEKVGIHESTVSRVTSNKYVATPRGVFELKYFFTSALAAADGGEDHSSEAVRDQLRDLIENETVNTVISDDKLVDILRSTGVGIARRTVTKYRNAMGIPPSAQRRRIKRMEARIAS